MSIKFTEMIGLIGLDLNDLIAMIVSDRNSIVNVLLLLHDMKQINNAQFEQIMLNISSLIDMDISNDENYQVVNTESIVKCIEYTVDTIN